MIKKLPLFLFFLILSGIVYLYVNTGNKKQENIVYRKSMVSKKKVIIENSKPKILLADKIVSIAKSKEGLPYKGAGITDKGYDCSGLVMTSFAKEGVQLPRSSFEMAKKGKEIELEDVKKGDLVFFATNSAKPDRINHVGLVTLVEDKVVYFIHSTIKQGVIVSNTEEKYYKNSFFKAKRVL